jgi:methylisocitrate lyase
MHQTAGPRFRELLRQPGILVVPGVFDCLGARLVERAGFDLVFTSGFGFSAALLGKPDFGFLTATETVEAVGRVAAAVNIPVVADLDTGYGNSLNVHRTVTEVVRMGVAGVILEDQEWPKKCGHFEGKRVVARDQHVEKIRAAVDARGDSGLVIIGRTDARATHGLGEAISRGRAYAEAGADVVFVEAPLSIQELRAVAEAFPDIPTFANMIEGGRTPPLSASELEQLGFKIVVFPLTGLFAAAAAMEKAFRFLKTQGATADLEPLLRFAEFERIIDLDRFRRLERRFTEWGSREPDPDAG